MNMRADSSSKLHPDHRWGISRPSRLPGAFHPEKFMKDIHLIDDRNPWRLGTDRNQSSIGAGGISVTLQHQPHTVV